jgi:hypothetical protein
MAWCVIKFDENWNVVSRDTYEQGEPHLETTGRSLVSSDQTLAHYPWLEGMEATFDNEGGLVGARLKSGFTPPDPAPSLEDHLAEIKAMVGKNLLASDHDKLWLAQKEVAKAEGIPWLKANPAATQEQFEAAVQGFIATDAPGDPMVVHPQGVIASYAKVAQTRGLISSATFEALRDFVVATPDKQLQKLLAQL